MSSVDSRRSTSPGHILSEFRNFDPPIVTCERDIPYHAMEVRRLLSASFGISVIPKEHRQFIEEETPTEAQDIPQTAFSNEFVDDMGALQSLRIRDFVRQIYNDAEDCWQNAYDESSWCEKIISQLLKEGATNATTTFKNIQNHNVLGELLPKPPLGLKIPRRSDYAFCFNEKNARIVNLFQRVRRKETDPGVTTPPSSRNSFIFGVIETKSASGDYVEAFTQMCVFLCVLFKKYSTLTNEVPPPLPGLITVGHKWLLYVSWMDGTTGMIHVHGPVEIVESSTKTYQGIFKILDLLKRVRLYAEEEILPWLERSL